ncbi:hypothetical protein [Kitasatospora sp. NPDC094016]|uniref:hypothetical protein n=1 Tax=Kitasatospora sp. NPDC094016 TaxID=3154986 RepID=UPI00331C9C5D
MWEHKALLLLPGIAGVVLAGLVGALASGVAGLWSGAVLGNVASVVVAILAVAVCATFFNAVLIFAADDALRGRPVGIAAGYGRALRRLPAIVLWALVGVVVIFLGSLLLVGIWWAMASYLVLPAMMIDGVGVREAMRTSRRAFRAHGGDSTRSSTWIALPVTLSVFPSVAVFGVGLTAVDRVSGVLATAGAALWLALAVTVTASLSGVSRVRRYRELTGRPSTAPTLPVLHVSPVE